MTNQWGRMNGIKYVWKMRTLFCGLIGVVFFSVSLLGQGGSDKIDLLIVDGFSNHDWKQTTRVVTKILEESDLFHVSVSTSPSTPDDEKWKFWNPDFRKYDVVLLNCNNIGNLWKGDIYPESYQCIGFQTTLIRAAEWLAKGKTSYKVPADFPTETDLSLRTFKE